VDKDMGLGNEDGIDLDEVSYDEEDKPISDNG
jgi:hypothetical protein